jgi:hypothetical protein
VRILTLARRPDVVRRGAVRRGAAVPMVRRQAKVAVRKADAVEGEGQTDVDRMMTLEIAVREIVARPIADLDAVKGVVQKGVARKGVVPRGAVHKLGAKAVVRAAEAQTVAVQKGVAPKVGAPADPMAWRSSRVRSGCSIGSMRTKTVR